MLAFKKIQYVRLGKQTWTLTKGFIRENSGNSHKVNDSQVELNQLDQKWTKIWRELSPNGSLHPTKHLTRKDAELFYCLSMFPYPSGMLHMGHLRVYTISDVIARYKRLQGYNVIHPMGWDAFGLPAENAAIEKGINPAIWTESNIAKMKEQMHLMLADFDWDREIATCFPDYYKWTQKVFLLMYEHGYAYRKEAEINWDPVDQTVLANEQVDSEGKSWRSGALVEKKKLRQWFISITKLASELNKDMEVLEKWPDKVRAMQRHWIGESDGAEIKFPTTDNEFAEIKIYTSRPETIFSVQFIALALDHPLVTKAAKDDPALQEFIESQEHQNSPPESKEGYLLKDLKASIPITVNNEPLEDFNLPIYACSYVLGSYGHGAVMGCPGHDTRDFDFWSIQNPGEEIIQVLGDENESANKTTAPFTGKEGRMLSKEHLHSGLEDLGEYEGKTSKEAALDVIKALEKLRLGKISKQYRLRDWLISRQRYWGAPIPIIHCDTCGTVPVPDDQLPVLLPKNDSKDFRKGNPLTKVNSFVNTKCPSCGSDAKRETDTMDTFMDSSWYFFRYLDPKNENLPFSYEEASKRMPIDMYVGGVEHAILHLLYSRFVSKFLGKIGLWNGEKFRNEPIKQLVTQGMVHGKTFTDPITGKFLKKEELDDTNPGEPRIIRTGAKPTISFEKMSKSKHNGADPATCIQKYGADAARAHMLFQAPPTDVLNWNESQIVGICRWLRKVLSLANSIALKIKEPGSCEGREEYKAFKNIELNGKVMEEVKLKNIETQLFKDLQEYITKISKSIEEDLSFNTIISDYMKLTNSLLSMAQSKESANPDLLFDAYKKLLIMMAPVTPSVAEESWQMITTRLEIPWKSIFSEQFPQAQPVEMETIKFNIFINGKARCTLELPKSFATESEGKIIESLKHDGVLSEHMGDGKVHKLIVKPGLISLVVR